MSTSYELITKANEIVPISALFREFGYNVPDADTASMKISCPWSYMHSDYGLDKAMRIYASNTAYCFAGCGFITPVDLAVREWSMSPSKAARKLLEQRGFKRQNLKEMWAEFKTNSEMVPDEETLSAALLTALSSIPTYKDNQYDPAVLATIDKFNKVLPQVTNEEKARLWLNAGKVRVQEILESLCYERERILNTSY